MTHDEVRQYCIAWGNMHPGTKGSITEIIQAMAPLFTGPQKGLLLVLAAYADKRDADRDDDVHT